MNAEVVCRRSADDGGLAYRVWPGPWKDDDLSFEVLGGH